MHETKKIPTILGILLVIAITIGIGFAFQFFTKTQTRASTSIEPQHVTATNITDSGFTLVWQTQEAASGSLLVTNASGKKYSGFDERDVTGKLGKYVNHSVVIRSLTPSTVYDITILSNGKKYPTDQKSYQVTTFAAIDGTPATIDPSYGKVITVDSSPAEGAVVYLTLPNSQTLSSLVRNSGSWIIPLSGIRTTDGSSYIPYEERITETLVVERADVESRVLTDTLNDSPVPDITLGQQSDFRNRDAKKPTTSSLASAVVPTTKPSSTVLGATTMSGSVSLIAPAEGAAVSTYRPQISGTGAPGKKVTIALGLTNPFTGTATVGKDGLWKYTPTKALPPGKQRVTISTFDIKNKPIVITHTFTVLKSGSQVLGDATESATLTETPTETPTPSQESTESATIASEPMPTSGSYIPTLILLLVGSALFIGGSSILLIK